MRDVLKLIQTCEYASRFDVAYDRFVSHQPPTFATYSIRVVNFGVFFNKYQGSIGHYQKKIIFIEPPYKT